MSEPLDDWGCKFDASPELVNREVSLDTDESRMSSVQLESNKEQKDLSFPCVPSLSEDDDEQTEVKIKAFLDEKVLLLVGIKLIIQRPSFHQYFCLTNCCFTMMMMNDNGPFITGS
jgi:hypothetical protein